VGIVDPPDDLNLANPPSNEKLLLELIKGFVESGYDMKWLHRTIANSDTYQRSWVPNATNRLDTHNFSHALIRRMPAEVTVDAIATATASTSNQASINTDVKKRAIFLGGAGPTGGTAVSFALHIFGQADRRTLCDCSRDNDPSVAQSIYLQNDNDINQALDRPDGWLKELIGRSASNDSSVEPDTHAKLTPQEIDQRIAMIQKRLASGKLNEEERKQASIRLKRLEHARSNVPPAPAKAPLVKAPPAPANSRGPNPAERQKYIEDVFLRTVTRFPTSEERAEANRYLMNSPDKAAGLRDLLWAMLNTKEFITNH
jgi:hypothetical protein